MPDPPKVTTWDSGSDQFTVETPREPGETPAEWTARHQAVVQAAKQRWPMNTT